MSRFTKVVEAARRSVTPDEEERERLSKLSSSIMAKTRASSRRFPEVRGVVLGGSYAKGTWLPHDVDIDVFVKLNPESTEERFESVGLAIGSEVAAGYPRGKRFAQHPYTEATIDGVKVNIVPCFDVQRGEWRSAADRSPYHVKLVKKIPEEQKTQIRLVKRMMKSVGVYGAEIERQGFSGYAAEVLTIDHHDLRGVIEYFAEYRPRSQDEQFVLPDPVDKNRDLAKAISREKLARMIMASRGFLSKPSPKYFTGLTGKRHSSLESALVGIAFEHEILSEDTLWGELKRTLRRFSETSEREGFRIARSLATTNGLTKSAFLFIPEVSSLPELEQRVGPTLDLAPESSQFILKNKSRAKLLWIGEDGRLRILQRRRFTKLEDFLKELVKNGGMDVGASRELAEGLSKTGRVLSPGQLRHLSRQAWLRRGVVEIVSDTSGAG